MTELPEVELKLFSLTILTLEIILTLLKVCEIGMKVVPSITPHITMTELPEVELKLFSLTILTLEIILTLLKVCEIGIFLHTSAKFCMWNTNVYFT